METPRLKDDHNFPSKCVASSYWKNVRTVPSSPDHLIKGLTPLRVTLLDWDPWESAGWSTDHSAAETEDGVFTTGIICGRHLHMCDVGSYGAYEGIGTPRKRTSEKKALLIFGKSLLRFRVSFQRCSSEHATFLFIQLIELEIVTRALLMRGLMLMAVSWIMYHHFAFVLCCFSVCLLKTRHQRDSKYLVNKLVLFQATLFQTPVMWGTSRDLEPPVGLWCGVIIEQWRWWKMMKTLDTTKRSIFPKISWYVFLYWWRDCCMQGV